MHAAIYRLIVSHKYLVEISSYSIYAPGVNRPLLVSIIRAQCMLSESSRASLSGHHRLDVVPGSTTEDATTRERRDRSPWTRIERYGAS